MYCVREIAKQIITSSVSAGCSYVPLCFHSQRFLFAHTLIVSIVTDCIRSDKRREKKFFLPLAEPKSNAINPDARISFFCIFTV